MSSIRTAVDAYINDLDALRGMIEPVMTVSAEIGKRYDSEHLASLEKYGEEVESEGTTRNFRIPAEHSRKVRRLATKNLQFRTADKLFPRTFLVSFVSAYDAFLGNLVEALFESRPEVLNASGKLLTYKELTEFNNLAAARAYVVESEVESLLRKSHSEQFDWLEKTFDIKLRKGLKSWSRFIELTERRNLFVHNHGKVSSQYLKVCGNNSVDISGIKIGDTLSANQDYLVESYKTLYEIGIKLSQVLWRKMLPNDLEGADVAIINLTFELISLEKYDLSKRLLHFIVDLPKQASDANRRTCIVNLAQTYKHSGNNEKCQEILKSTDWSACSDNFAVCIAALNDKHDEAERIMRSIGSDGLIKAHDYMEWPVFKSFRKSKQFATAYKDLFGAEPTELQKHLVNPDSTSATSE